jgi:hypothetical protein
MSNHVTEWLNAYFDGELKGRRLHQVEEHLAECALCQTELESLQGLSFALHEIPAPAFGSLERFTSQVNLRLRHDPAMGSTKQVMGFGWWLIPVGLLGAWVFVGTAMIMADILSTAASLGLLSGMSAWLASGPSNDIYLSATIGQMGLLSGNSLNWAEATETFTRISLPQIGIQIAIALLYLSWMAIWWARHTRQAHGQLPEG